MHIATIAQRWSRFPSLFCPSLLQNKPAAELDTAVSIWPDWHAETSVSIGAAGCSERIGTIAEVATTSFDSLALLFFLTLIDDCSASVYSLPVLLSRGHGRPLDRSAWLWR